MEKLLTWLNHLNALRREIERRRMYGELSNEKAQHLFQLLRAVEAELKD